MARPPRPPSPPTRVRGAMGLLLLAFALLGQFGWAAEGACLGEPPGSPHLERAAGPAFAQQAFTGAGNRPHDPRPGGKPLLAPGPLPQFQAAAAGAGRPPAGPAAPTRPVRRVARGPPGAG